MPLKNGLLAQRELMAISEDELYAKIDHALDGTASSWRVTLAGLYREELMRRRQEKGNERMLDWTRQVRNMTLVILVLTVINVVAMFVR